ncbi:hypothetical protein HUG10_16680 [Halorarum halophilum]|uniref:Uncharacterized protein n=1 Tax=Halorarum halophilum TaxID=2743090 RepID=A0A7D5GN56_9EURY|nr:hypothetical protein [Halobaculum halophilum]QLG29064.1 hypothetical protein HUG10_16680 [Halobaculum halophilum]
MTTTVTRDANGETVFSDTRTIPADESASYRNPITGEELFLIRVSVENGPEDTYECDLPDSNAYGLSIRITRDAIEFQRMAT